MDENNKKVAVQIDIDTFKNIEEVLENFGLVKLIEDSKKEEKLNLAEARAYYNSFD